MFSQFSPALTLTLIYHNPGQLVNNTCLYLVAIFFVLAILHLSAVRYIFVCQQFWGDDAGSRCNILCSCNNPSGFDTVTFSFVNNSGNDAAARKYYWLLVQLCSLQYSLCCNNPSGFDTVTFSFVNNSGNDAAARKYYWLLVQLCSLQYSLCCNNPSGFDTVTSTIPETMLLSRCNILCACNNPYRYMHLRVYNRFGQCVIFICTCVLCLTNSLVRNSLVQFTLAYVFLFLQLSYY